MNTVKRISILILFLAPGVAVGCLLGDYLQGVVLAVVGGLIGVVLGLAVKGAVEAAKGRLPTDFGMYVMTLFVGACAAVCLFGMGIAAVVKVLV